MRKDSLPAIGENYFRDYKEKPKPNVPMDSFTTPSSLFSLDTA